MRKIASLMIAAASGLMTLNAPVRAETTVWGIQIDRLEQQWNKEGPAIAWETRVQAGGDDLKFVWQSEGEYQRREQALESLENRLLLQAPVTDFFDLTGGISINNPAGPDRLHGVLGLTGLAPQWLEVEASAYLSDRPFIRAEMEYEALITNWVTLQPVLEVDLPLADDTARGLGAFAPVVEVGARLSYDLVDRAIVPYVGVQAERAFGKSANLRRAAGDDAGSVSVLIGARFMF